MKAKTIACAVCREPLDHDETLEDERLAELQANFGDVPVSDCEVVCDECYRKVMIWHLTAEED